MGKKIKKALIISIAVSLFISLSVFAIEGISAYKYHKMPICEETWGGECKEYIGIGWNMIEMFPMTVGNAHLSSAPHEDVRIGFNRNIFGFFVITWAVSFAVFFLIFAVKKDKKSSEQR